MSASSITDKIGVSGPNDAKAADLATDIKDYQSRENRITTDYGVKQSNTDDWLKASTGDHIGPMLLEDHMAREKIHRFDHERIPERVVHARGAGAFGTFKLHKSLERYTCAKVLTDTSRRTPVFQRCSTVLGSRGSADTVRDVRGFAIKFYTEEGKQAPGRECSFIVHGAWASHSLQATAKYLQRLPIIPYSALIDTVLYQRPFQTNSMADLIAWQATGISLATTSPCFSSKTH